MLVPEAPMIRALNCQDFPPFGEITIFFPPIHRAVREATLNLGEVHLLTGINGTGKTRILAALAAFLGNSEPLKIRHPRQEKVTRFRLSVDSFNLPNIDWDLIYEYSNTVDQYPGNPNKQGRMFEMPSFAYSGNAYVTNSPVFGLVEVPTPDKSSALNFYRPPDHSKVLLQIISNLIIQGGINSRRRKGSEGFSALILQRMESAVFEITGKTLFFEFESIPKLNLSVLYDGASLSFDQLPDGLRSIIGWLVNAAVMMNLSLLGKSNPFESEVVFLLDEIESHLHPAWQRKILPAFQRLFPKAQIFCATHSPFVISSITHGYIHLLKANETTGHVTVTPREAKAGDSYISVLEEIMGVRELFDIETEKLLALVRQKRDAVFAGNASAYKEALELAETVKNESLELRYIIGQELRQMERHRNTNS